MKLTKSLLICTLVVFLFALVPAAFAQDIFLEYNGEDFPEELELKPGDKFNLTYKVNEGVLIKYMKVTVDSSFVQSIIDKSFDPNATFVRTNRTLIHTTEVEVPGLTPNIDARVEISLEYENIANRTESMHKNIDVKVSEGSALSNALMWLLPDGLKLWLIEKFA